jgi:hypothetical protein
MHQDVIKVHQALLTGNTRKHLVHQPHKGGRGIAKSKTEDLELPQPSSDVDAEGFLGFGLWRERYLVISTAKIQGGQPG